VRAIAQGASERNISVVVDGKGGAKALRAVHAAFYLSPNTLSIGLIGAGHRGPGAAGTNRHANRAAARSESGYFACVELPPPNACCWKRRRWILDGWEQRLAEAGVPLDLEKFANHVQADYVPHTVMIDCTASADVCQNYVSWLTRGIHVVTPK